jgi:asparagine synthase (glutamine-hydrolysing)
MRHRGPDDAGTVVVNSAEPTIGVCATRLAIQDPSPRGRQPMRSESSGAVVVFNGEVYNVAELRDALQARGHRFRGRSDTEVILRGYEEWDKALVERLRGMFALAVWDPGARRLVLARDRFGIKPLYYRERDGQCLFASEVRTLLASGLVSRRPSEAGIASFLAWGSVRDPYTMVDGVHSLPAGHRAIWQDGRLTIDRWWSLEQSFLGDPSDSSRSAAVRRVRALLEEAVALHLISDVPLGVFLSGGIDSSALTALAATVGEGRTETISVVFRERRYSEQPFIRAVAERFSARHTEVEMTDNGTLAELPGAIEAMDQPTVDGINTFIVSQAARRAGLTVALAGIGGDELFAGYPSFRRIVPLEVMRKRLRGPAASLAGIAVRGLYRDSDRGRKLGRWLRESDPNLDVSGLERELFSPETARALAGTAWADWSSSSESFVDWTDRINALSAAELTGYMRNTLLRDSDFMSMAHSLEVRVPFVDHELAGYVGNLPGSWKLDGRRPKPLLVEALADLLPRAVIDRPKMGFTFPWDEWLRGGLRSEVEQILLDQSSGGPLADRLDPAAVEDVWRRFLRGRGGWSRAWALYVLKRWCDRHLA